MQLGIAVHSMGPQALDPLEIPPAELAKPVAFLAETVLPRLDERQ